MNEELKKIIKEIKKKRINEYLDFDLFKINDNDYEILDKFNEKFKQKIYFSFFKLIQENQKQKSVIKLLAQQNKILKKRLYKLNKQNNIIKEFNYIRVKKIYERLKNVFNIDILNSFFD